MTFITRLFLSFYLISPFAFAGHLSNQYRHETNLLLEQLTDLPKIACHSRNNHCTTIDELKDLLKKTEFIELIDFSKPALATRQTAFYSDSKNEIYLNLNASHDIELMGFMGIHELLGVAGVRDEEYGLTTHLFHYFRIRNRPDADPLKSFLRRKIERFGGDYYSMTEYVGANDKLLLRGGSATIVGGGGDLKAFQQRLAMQDYWTQLSALYFKNETDLIQDFTQFPIEIVEENGEKVEYVFENFKMSSENLLRHSLEPRHILIPKNLLSTKPIHHKSAPNRALEIIAEYYLKNIVPSSHRMNKKILM